ncbi:unnamed protein product [Brassicogethes aeneus]|uniref:Uncharacterized protein n=1 Tax=Brassicogethes aeneus TaxID=1431903 RepID=A0A9P0AXY4_BRAAE|nr:unnamed protein product [Brassicogethes aeneus]
MNYYIPDTNCPTEPMIGSPPANDSSEMSPNSTNGVSVGGAAAVGGGRKRPLLAGGPRTSMTPTKRTVMSLLARARAAQAKQLPTAFQRTTPEYKRMH